MSKPVYGLLLGAVLGIFDGATAWFTPAVRNEMLGIIIGSTFKGLLVGLAAGFFAKKVNSVAYGVAFGLLVGFLLAYAVAAMPAADGQHYYFEIILPGSILGAIVGYATQRHAGSRRSSAARA